MRIECIDRIVEADNFDDFREKIRIDTVGNVTNVYYEIPIMRSIILKNSFYSMV